MVQNSKAHRRNVLFTRLAPAMALMALCVIAASLVLGRQTDHALENYHSTRRSLYVYDAGVCDSSLQTNYPLVATALLSWGIFYMFWGLAMVCDDYFVTSLEDICEDLNLSTDVAGATFMAAGSSAPELFTSLMGVFAVKNDVGIGTIVGSAVFNLCCIIGGTALFMPRVLTIDWKPITRDTIFYGFAIVGMIYVLADGMVELVEAVVLVFLYFLYVVVMFFNPKIMEAITVCVGENPAEKLEDEEPEPEDDDDESSWQAQALARPLGILLEYTIPDCKKEGMKKWHMVTFFMSIIWIGILSYFMVDWASSVGCLWGIHPAVMGVTILAAGTSVPDAIGSLLVAQKGFGDMAVSNAIGSNVFDILLGLGLPWMLSCLIFGTGVPVDAKGLLPMSIILFSTLGAVYLVMLLGGFRLTKTVGFIFFSFYFVFVAYNLSTAFGLVPF